MPLRCVSPFLILAVVSSLCAEPTELQPRYILETPAEAPFAADGVADAKEWPRTAKPPLECVNEMTEAPSQHLAQARIGFDGRRLRFFTTVDVDPQKPIVGHGKWGSCDGVELALSNTDDDAPVLLVRIAAEGTLDVTSPSPNGAEACKAIRKAIDCGTKSEKERWTAELAVPVEALGIQPGAFRQVRFNMNVYRTCDGTQTCWWTPNKGIEDLPSAGFLIVPRPVPETPEMIRRREAAKPLFEAEANGALGWSLLKDWTVTADPDCLGPAAQPTDAPEVSFKDYAGWAVARCRFPLTAQQAAAPFCALFFPCVDEAGDVYVDGKLALSHTAKATGIAPGKLWRRPFFVDLKKCSVEAGDVTVAVHLRGNMGTGGLHKGAFLVWGQAAPGPEPFYDFLAENPKLGRRDRVPAFWQDFQRVSIPPIPPAADEDQFGRRIQRTMDLLASSTPERRNHVRILFYGQSIVAGMHCREMINVLRDRYPWAVIDVENRAIGGFTAPSLIRPAVHDLYPRDVDLVVFHVYGGETDGTLEQIIADMRKRNSSDILVYTHHYTWTANPRKMREGIESRDASAAYWLELAEKYQLEVAPVRRDWPLYFRNYDWGINEVMGDTVHSNVHHNPAGHTLLAKLVLRNFRHHPGNPVPFADAVRRVPIDDRSVTTAGAWSRTEGALRTREKDARLTLTFDGNRVDLIPAPTATPGSARIRIDGRSPAELPELYYCSRPSGAPYAPNWPALKRVTLSEGILPRLETWTLTPLDVDIQKGTLSFRLEGSIAGPDGTGSKAADFVSNSGRIQLARRDFMICWPCIYRKKDRLPDDYKATWEVRPLFADPWRVPAGADPSVERPVTILKGLANGPHKLEIIANGDGEIPIRGIIVRKPPYSRTPDEK